MGGRDVGWVGFLCGWMDGCTPNVWRHLQFTSSHGGSGWIEAVVS